MSKLAELDELCYLFLTLPIIILLGLWDYFAEPPPTGDD